MTLRAAAIGRTAIVLAAGPAALLAVALAVGLPPVAVFRALASGALGGLERFSATLLVFAPLLVTSLGVSVAMRCGVWNIGAEGQYLLGALAAAAIGVSAGGLPAWLAIPAVLLGAALAGAAWAGIAAWLKLARGVQEVLSTILLNFVAIQCVAIAVHGPLTDPRSTTGDTTAAVAEVARLPLLASRGGLHAGLLLALAAAIALWYLLAHTTIGLRIRIVGANPIAARFAHLPIGRYAWMTFLLSGALAGLAGGIELSGNAHYLTASFGAGYGYTAIAVAMLARLSPVACVPAALFFAALDVGVRGLQSADSLGAATLPSSLTFLVQGTAVLMAALMAGPPRRTGDT